MKEEKNHGRSLSWTDSSGTMYQYYKRPLAKACLFILVQEACERLAYYGIMPNLQNFLSQTLAITANDANQLISIFQALVYFFPLISATLADTWLGFFKTILLFSCIYMAGLTLLSISAIPSISQTWMVYVALMGLIALGAGGIKSCVNVMGASQFHPTEHQKEITRFFTFFYAAINIGAIVGGIVVPLVKQVTGSFFISYLIPLGSFAIATLVFVIGSPRYVKMNPQGSQVLEILKVIWTSMRNCVPVEMCKESRGGSFKDQFIDDTKSLGYLMPLFALTVPFNICYNQMQTAFFTQSQKLKSTFFGVEMEPAQIQNVDPIAVIAFSFMVEYFLYNQLRRWNMMPSILVRFSIGCIMGSLSVLCAMGLEFAIMNSPDPWETISIWWQVPQFSLVALGEIFLISTSYEVAFTYAPESLKGVGSGLNLVFMAIAAFISAALFGLCASWMPDFEKNNPASWQDCHFDYFFILLACISFAAAVASLACNPYFVKYVKKPIEREPRSSSGEQAELAIIVQDGSTANVSIA